MNVASGTISWIRIITSSVIAAARKVSAVAMYIRPTALWSPEVTRPIQSRRPSASPSETTSG